MNSTAKARGKDIIAGQREAEAKS